MGVLDAVPESSTLISAMVECIGTYDKDLWATMSLPESAHRRDNYLIRYGLPLAELYGWPERDDPFLAEALGVHFLWALAWRHLDNILDGNMIDQFEVGNLGVALCRASMVHCQVALKRNLSWSEEVFELLRMVCTTARDERCAAIPRENIWQRAAPFFIVPRTLLRLDPEREALYRAYINLDGLAHDINDLLDDVKRGIVSLPASWFADLDVNLGFRRDIVDAWFAQAKKELTCAANEVEMRVSTGHFPLLRVFLREVDDLRQSLGPYSSPSTEPTSLPPS